MNGRKLLNSIVKIANHLDSVGMFKEAVVLDFILEKIAVSEISREEIRYFQYHFGHVVDLNNKQLADGINTIASMHKAQINIMQRSIQNYPDYLQIDLWLKVVLELLTFEKDKNVIDARFKAIDEDLRKLV